MKPINQERIDDLVYKQLMDNIKTNVWKSGDKLPSENELCAQLNVSRISVRAAIQRLKSIGLVESKKGKGTYVCSNDDLFDFTNFKDTLDLNETEYREINELREALERSAVQDIVLRRERADMSHIREAYEGMCRAAERFDYVELTKYDLNYHCAIVVAGGNSRFIQVLKIFREDYYRVLLETNKLLLRDYPDEKKMKKHFEDCLKHHEDLLLALSGVAGDALKEQNKFMERQRERVEHFFASHYEPEEQKEEV